MTKISYMTPHGKAIDLSASDWDTGLRYGGLSGLKAKADTTTIQAIGQPGQVVESVRFPAMEGTLTVALSGKGGPVDQVYRRLCAAFSHTLPGTLRIHTPCHGMVSAQVRLAGFITPPKADLDLLGEETVDAVEIPLICDQGVWWTQQVTGVGAVDVINDGEIAVAIHIRWKDKGGKVTLPSGAMFDLPPASDWRTLILDPEESCVVLDDDDGQPDYGLWPSKISVVPELVPPNQKRRFILPAGACAMWRIALTDPWEVIYVGFDWGNHKKHRDHLIADQGQWLGLLDENATPMMDLPPIVEMSLPEATNDPASGMVKLRVQSARGVVHPVISELVADGLGKTDEVGKLVPLSGPTRFFAIERAGHRRVFRVEFVVAEGGAAAPVKLTIHGTDMSKMLARFPAMSAPTTWAGKWATFTRDWAGPDNVGVRFEKPRDLHDIKLATVADGVTVEGPADQVIRRVIAESLAAVWRAIGQQGLIDDPPVQVAPATVGHVSPHVLIRPTDGSIWEELAPVAAAGVMISASMWWPTDPAIPGLTLTRPTVVVRVDQREKAVSNV
ncbi:hypothetical protein [Corynebacterium silvaticum]|nr:hypothetical protein [Corynebacterium silvaticum]